MSNKIESFGTQAATAPARVRPAAAGDSGAVRSVAVPATDSVRLTDDARMLQALRDAAAQAPAVDGQRVAETRLALAEGRYTINPERIASQLARMEWELSRQ